MKETHLKHQSCTVINYFWRKWNTFNVRNQLSSSTEAVFTSKERCYFFVLFFCFCQTWIRFHEVLIRSLWHVLVKIAQTLVKIALRHLHFQYMYSSDHRVSHSCVTALFWPSSQIQQMLYNVKSDGGNDGEAWQWFPQLDLWYYRTLLIWTAQKMIMMIIIIILKSSLD